LYANSTLPKKISPACRKALLGEVSCDAAVTYFQPQGYYGVELLQKVCEDDCTASLLKFEGAVVKACSSETFGGEENWDLSINPTFPIAMIPNKLRFNYELTCLKDNGRFCNVVLGDAAASSNQDESIMSNSSEVGFHNSSQFHQQAIACDLCVIKSLQYQAAAPYDDGPFLREDSVYQSVTSSCAVTSLPPTTWTLPYSTSATVPTPTCSGESYRIKNKDTCYSISKSQGIGTGWLLTDNGLLANCINFPTNGTLCLKNTCKVYQIAIGDTCSSIAKKQKITAPQLQAWNLVLNERCDNISKLNGTQLCVSNPGAAYTPPNTTIINPTTASTEAPIPTQTGKGSNSYCGEWHIAVSGEYCNILTYRYHISLPDFVFLNPSINENCTNLWANYAYCVHPVGDINTYSGRPGFSTHLPTPTNISNWTNLPAATFTTPKPSTTEIPLASGVRGDCARYFRGSDFPGGINGTGWAISACERVANAYGVSLDDLTNWNTGLNASASDCSFKSNLRYCAQWYHGYNDPPVPATPTPVLLPIRDGAIANCTEYVSAFYGWTCDNILETYSISIAQFFSWNPAVGSDCSNLWPNYRYCVRPPGWVDPTITTTGPMATTTGSPKPSPVQAGQPSNCNSWHKAIEGDGCWSIANDALITSDQFYAWNPAVGDQCANGVWLGYYYCIGTSGTGQTTRSRSSIATKSTKPRRSSSSLPSKSTTEPSLPQPTQDNNIIASCNKYDKAVDGDACWSFADRNKITLAQLGTWNALLKPDGSGCAASFWLSYYYCVGV
ncbi:hypothetical protein EJ04DRAFT_395349, partial [Polyplosphaeria fusca]